MSPDLELALRLADAADAHLAPALPLRPRVRDESRPLAGHRGRPRRRGADPRAPRRRAPERRDPRRGGGPERRRRAPLDRRPDRRDAELRARDPGVGDAHRARGGRRAYGSASSRRPRSAGAGGPSATQARSRTATASASPRSRSIEQAVLSRSPTRTRFRSSRPGALARARLRGLLGAHARRGGRGRRRGRRRRRLRVGPRRGAGDRRGGRRALLRLLRRRSRIDAGTARRSNGLLHDELLAAVRGRSPARAQPGSRLRRAAARSGRGCRRSPARGPSGAPRASPEAGRGSECASRTCGAVGVVVLCTCVHLPPGSSRKVVRLPRSSSSDARHAASAARPSSVSVYVRFAGRRQVGLPLGGHEALLLEPSQRAIDVAARPRAPRRSARAAARAARSREWGRVRRAARAPGSPKRSTRARTSKLPSVRRLRFRARR